MRQLLAVAFVLLGSAACCAQEIVLIDGRYLHARKLETSDRGITVLDLGTNGRMFVPWPLIREEYRKPLMIAAGLEEDDAQAQMLEPGARITMKTGDVFEGRIEGETAETLRLLSNGAVKELPVAQIKDREQTDVSALAIHTADQIYKAATDALKPEDADQLDKQMDMAKLAERLGLYEQAAKHLLKVQATDANYETDRVTNTLKKVDVLAKNKNVLTAIGEARRDGQYNQFDRSLKALGDLAAIKDLDPLIVAQVKTEADHVTKLRYEYYRKIVRDSYLGLLQNKLQTMSVDPKKVSWPDAQKRLGKEITDEVVSDMAKFNKLDPKEVKQMWKDRNFNQPRYATYGSGTFIVLPKPKDVATNEANLKQQLAQQLNQRNKSSGSKSSSSSNGSMQAEGDKLPKPPTKEEWWEKVSSATMRQSFMYAYWAEKSKGQVEVVSTKVDECPACGGKGSKTFDGSQGETISVTCTRCQGHKNDRVVVFK